MQPGMLTIEKKGKKDVFLGRLVLSSTGHYLGTDRGETFVSYGAQRRRR